MGQVFIQSRRLDLVLEDPAAVLVRIEALPPEDRAEVSPDWLAKVRNASASDFWLLGFALVDRTGGINVGSCGFKGPPDAEGMVEIAYGIDPNHRGHGYATEAAQAMTDFALADKNVRLVRAHTRPDNLASQRVLLKCAFVRIGEVIDPEDGLVCRWERR